MLLMVEPARDRAASDAVADDLEVFVALERRARAAETIPELAFILANETIALIDFVQAAVFEANGKLAVLSGVSLPDDRSPFSIFLANLQGQLPKGGRAPVAIGSENLSPELARTWKEWLAPCAIWVPPEVLGWGLLVAREHPFTDQEITWLGRLSEVFAHARRALLSRRWSLSLKLPAVASWAIAAGIIALCLAAPIRLTVLAQAEIVPIAPTVVRSPIDGVIDRIFIQPNERITKGSQLVQLDKTTIAGKLEIATQELVAAQAEYRQTVQLAIGDPKMRAQLVMINGRIESRSAEIAYLRALLDKTSIDAPVPGLVSIDEPSELIGRPLSIGERILTIVDENQVEIEAWVSPSDAIPFSEEGTVTLILSAEPMRPIVGQIRYMAYDVQTRPDGTSGYRVRAQIKPGQFLPRLGSRGTLRIQGEYVSVAYWIFRRPIAALRQFIGA